MSRIIQGIASVIIAMIAVQASARAQPIHAHQQEKVEIRSGNSRNAAGGRLMIASAKAGSGMGAPQAKDKPAPSTQTSSKTTSNRGKTLIERNKAAKERTKKASIRSHTSDTAASQH